MRLRELGAIRHRFIRADEHDGAQGIRKARAQEFRYKTTDIPGAEIEAADHLPADKAFRGVVLCDLRRALLCAEFRPEIHPYFIGWLSRLWKRFGLNDSADAQLHGFELLEGNVFHLFAVFLQAQNGQIILLGIRDRLPIKQHFIPSNGKSADRRFCRGTQLTKGGHSRVEIQNLGQL